MTTAAFFTEDGVRVPAVSTEVMREIDRIAVEETGPNLFQMMENAGRSLALAVIERIGADWASTPIVVLAGTGGNGGGGICAARHLANRGADVTVVLTDPPALSPVAHEQLDTYRGTGGSLVPAEDLALLEPGFIVDAVIGYSLGASRTGPLGASSHGWRLGLPPSFPLTCLQVSMPPAGEHPDLMSPHRRRSPSPSPRAGSMSPRSETSSWPTSAFHRPPTDEPVSTCPGRCSGRPTAEQSDPSEGSRVVAFTKRQWGPV